MLFAQMQKLAEELRFEEAEAIKQKYLLLENFCSKSEVVSHTINNVDVFSVTDDEKTAYVNYIHVMNGSINQAFTFEMKKKLNESEDETCSSNTANTRESGQYVARNNSALYPRHDARRRYVHRAAARR